MRKLDRLHILWESNRWDGPLCGMCLLDGEKCWFGCVGEELEKDPNYDPPNEDEDEEDGDFIRHRTFHVYRLTREQLEFQEHWHVLFRKYVGEHSDYDENGEYRQAISCLHPETHMLFFDGYNKVKDTFSVEGNEVLATFEEVC